MQLEFSDTSLATPFADRPVAALELAGRVLQAVSAIYVIVSTSNAPSMNEVNAAMGRIRDWMGELDDVIAASESSERALLLHASLALGRAVVEVRQLVSPAAPSESERSAILLARCIANAAASLDRIHGAKDMQNVFIANCCASDVHHVSESRTY